MQATSVTHSHVSTSSTAFIEDPAILRTAMELVLAEWDGISLEQFQPSKTNPNLL